MDEYGADWRPPQGLSVGLTDAHLAKIGLTTVFEARAKTLAAVALKVVERRSHEEWIKIERMQFRQITERLIRAVEGVEVELRKRVECLEQARVASHDFRHMIVHNVWGGTPHSKEHPPSAYDYSRGQLLEVADIEAAVSGCAELHQAAHSVVYWLAKLIERGVYTERDVGTPGVSIRTDTRLVRL